MGESVVVALRTGDGALAEQVGQVVGWWEGRLVVRPPGSPPPPADVHVDSAAERQPGDPAWSRGPGISVVRSGSEVPGAIVLPERAGELADAISVALAARSNRTIGVVGARGGAGTSVLAALVARSLTDRGRAAALIDLAGGLEHLLALEDEPGPRWADLEEEAAPFVGSQLAGLLPRWGRVPVLGIDARGRAAAIGPALEALHESVAAAVIDAGRELPPVPCRPLFVLTTPEPGAVLRARSLVHAAAGASCEPQLVLRRLPGVVVDPREVEDVCGAPVAAVLPHARRLPADIARGVTPGERRRSALTRAARQLTARALP